MQHFTSPKLLAVLLLSGSLIGILGGMGGCASSVASRASRANESRLGLKDYRQAAKQLAIDIVSSPKFKKFRDEEVGNNGEIVIMLDDYKNSTSNASATSDLRQLFSALEENLTENDMTFRQDLDPKEPNYSGAGARMDKQDFDDRYDQTTGTVSTGSAKKAVLTLQLELQADSSAARGGGNVYDYVLYARLISSNKTTLISKPYELTKTN